MPRSLIPRDALDHKLAEAFRNCLPLPAHVEPTLAGSVEHALRHAGSLVRARVCYLLSKKFGLSDGSATHLGVSIELFHTASLLLDDLPCMDNAAERRGAPCVHVKFGEAAAILSALGLINRAYSLLWSAMQDAPPEARRQASEFVDQCLGLAGILNGQSCDLQYRGAQRKAGTAMRVAVGKTVSLIRMTLVLPAILGGASETERRLLNKLSVFWGLAYQVMDDLKDVLAATTEAGKTTQRDALLGRPNVALAEGPLRTSRLLSRLICLGDSALAGASQHLRITECLQDLRARIAAELSPLQASQSSQ